MKEVVKQVLGVDVDKNELVSTLGRIHNDLTLELYAHKVFKNSDAGVKALVKWANSLIDTSKRVQYVMEATGVYHQRLAYLLEEQGHDVSVVLPSRISNYMKTLEIKTITDKSCSRAITQFGLERNLDLWKRPNKVYKELQQLTRERDQIVEQRVVLKNQVHAENSEYEPNKSSLKRMEVRIKLLNKQEKEIKEDIGKIVAQEKNLQAEVNNICTIPGVGTLTAVIVLAETNGFELIRNKKQLSSYAGFDVKEKQSGTSVKKKPKISKRGNKNLRKAMYLPSLSAVKYNKSHKELYNRIVSKSGIKMKGLIAVQRKLLELIYTIDKNNTTFNNDFEQEKRASNRKLVDAL